MKKEYPRVETILRLLAGGTVLTSLILNPPFAFGLASAMGMLVKNSQEWEQFPRNQLKKTIDRLRKRKLVKLMEYKNETVIELTDFGRKEILRFDIEKIKIDKPKKWDGKWWLVIFDIPNTKKRARDCFQQKLKELNFYFIQESVALNPYPCRKEIEFLREVYGISRFVNLLRVDYFEEEYKAKKKFGL